MSDERETAPEWMQTLQGKQAERIGALFAELLAETVDEVKKHPNTPAHDQTSLAKSIIITAAGMAMLASAEGLTRLTSAHPFVAIREVLDGLTLRARLGMSSLRDRSG